MRKMKPQKQLGSKGRYIVVLRKRLTVDSAAGVSVNEFPYCVRGGNSFNRWIVGVRGDAVANSQNDFSSCMG